MSHRRSASPRRFLAASVVFSVTAIAWAVSWAEGTPERESQAVDQPAATAGAPNAATSANKPTQPGRLFDLMFFEAGSNFGRGFTTWTRVFESGGMMTNDPYIASMRDAKIEVVCRETLRILSATSPPTDPSLLAGEAQSRRRRLLACEVASSTDPTLRSGEFDTVGDFVLLREEPNREFGGVRSDAPKLDGVKVYVFLDRVCKDGDVPADLAAHLVHDIGGYLFANAEYFLNSDPTVKVKKAETKAVDAAGRDLMKSIGESIEANKGYVEVMASRNRPYFEEWAKRN